MKPPLSRWIWLSMAHIACTDAPALEDTSTDPPGLLSLPSFEEIYSEPLGFGATWCGLSYDGSELLITSEAGGEIWGARHDLNGLQLEQEVQLASRTDAGEQQIADHVQLFDNGRHLISFSVAGEGQGGDLFFLVVDEDLERISLEQLLSDEPPTNDMFMVNSGDGVGIGIFEPGFGHRILALDSELVHRDTVLVGGDEAVHANGASGVYVDDRIHLLAPFTLAPAANDRFIHLEIGGDWELLASQVVVEGEGDLGMVSALTHLPDHDLFVAHYSDGMMDTGGVLTRLIFDEDWTLLDQEVIFTGTWTRPKSLLVGSRLFLCADGPDHVTLNIYEIDGGA